jgi:hypothetical protein
MSKIYKLRIIKNFEPLYFRSYDDYQDISKELKVKYNESLKLYEKMTSKFPYKRPNCEEILRMKNLWPLNKEQLEINDELENIITTKERENEFTIYSILRSEINLIEN